MGASKVLFLSHSPDSGVFKVGSHHLARELSKLSVRVAHVSTPNSLVHKALRRQTKSTGRFGVTDEFGTLHVVPDVGLPIQLLKGGRTLGNIIRDIGFDDADYVLVDQPLMSGYVSACSPPGKVIYRPTDTYTNSVASRRQSEVVDRCDGIVATSAAVLNALNFPSALPSMVLTNGVELGKFIGVNSTERSGLIYVGAVDYRFDWNSVIAVATAFPKEVISVVGPVKIAVPSLPSNIRVLGSVAYDEIPGYLASAKVGLIPLNSSEVNQGRSPMKYYEYMAAGLSVVATSTESLRERSSSQTFLYESADDAVRAALRALQMPSPNIAGIVEAEAQDWSGKAAKLLQFLEVL